MTGELSLNGKIMKIGGVKEKTLAGKREGLTELIFPKENEEDVKDLKDYIREGVKFHFVSTYEEAMPILFPEVK
jgi:ATP-dependent Lon protease